MGLRRFTIELLILLFALRSMQAQPLVSKKAEFKPIESSSIHNFYFLGSGIYSGSAPEGKDGFETLKKLGIKTIISVDGSKPDVDLAHQYGLHYVHIPVGYDGIYESNAVQLVKAAQTVPGPIFVHCHHGLHRGAAGAAIICKGVEGWDNDTAMAWLKTAGTGTNYVGLFETVKRFQVPAQETLAHMPANFPEKVEVSGFVDTMVAIDERFDHLKLIRQAGYKTPANHPDLTPVNEALQLNELFRELVRSGEPQKRGDPLAQRMNGATGATQELYQLLEAYQKQPEPEALARLDKAYQAVNESCASCHKTYRNPLKAKR